MATSNLTPPGDALAASDAQTVSPHSPDASPEVKPNSKQPSTWVPRELLHARIRHSARLLFLCLADQAHNTTHLLTVDMNKIAARCGTTGKPMSRRTLERDFKELLDAKLIEAVSPATRTRGKVLRVDVPADRHLEIQLGYFWDGSGHPSRHADAARAFTGLLAILNVADFKTLKTAMKNASIAAAAPGREKGGNPSKNRSAQKHPGPRASRKTFQSWVEALQACAPPNSFVVQRTRDNDGYFSTNTYSLNPKALPPYQRADTTAVDARASTSNAALRATPGWRFMTKATRVALTNDANRWPSPVLLLASHLRDGIQTLKDEGATTSAHDVMISPSWLHTLAESVGESGFSLEDLTNVMDFALASRFERGNLLGNRHSTPAEKFRQHVSRLALTPEYGEWREIHGYVEYPAEVHDLCASMVEVLEHMYPGDKHEVDWRWRPVARDLLKQYTIDDIEDMMVWGSDSPRHTSNVGSLLMFGWVADRIRQDNDFIGWAQQRERPWALAYPLAERSTRSLAASNGKARGQRTGARTPDNEVFKKYAEHTLGTTTRSDSDIAARRADYIAMHPKNPAAALTARSRPGYEPIGSVDD